MRSAFGARCLQKCAYQGVILPLGGACALSVYTLVAIQRISLPLCLTTFLFIYASYMIDHLAEVGQFDERLSSERSRILAHKTRHTGLAFAAFAVAVGITWHFSGPYSAVLLLLFPVAVAFYGTPILGWVTAGCLGVERIKNFPYLKGLYTSFFWAMLFVFGSVFLGTPKNVTLVFFFGWMWMRDFINTAFCDCKDLDRDRAQGVSTLALRLGVPRAMRWLGLINIASVCWLVTFIAGHLLPSWLLSLCLIGIYTHWQLQCVLRPGANVIYLCDVMMDGEKALWLPCAVFGWGIMWAVAELS